jgi:hypothetical protein
LRTTFRDNRSSRQIVLIGFFWTKYARRIFAIVSTTSIPNLAPASPTEATVDPPSRGSRLDADHPENGVLIPRRFTDGLYVAGAIASSSLEEDLIVLRLRPSQSSLLQPIDIKPALCE